MEVTVEAVSRTVSMVCWMAVWPFSLVVVIVLMSFRTPFTIWREVSVTTVFSCLVWSDISSVVVWVVRVMLPTISVTVSE